MDSSELADYVGYLLAGHAHPANLNQELERIYSMKHLSTRYESECITSASTVINGKGVMPQDYVTSRAQCFAHEFKNTFTRHPLRKLSLADAFVKYVRKVLDD